MIRKHLSIVVLGVYPARKLDTKSINIEIKHERNDSRHKKKKSDQSVL